LFILTAITYILSGSLEILIPLYLGYYIHRRLGVSWRPWFIGALMFIISLVRLPVNNYVSSLLMSGEVTYYSYVMVYVVSALSAGVFEEVARYVGLKYLVSGTSYAEGVAYGAGHGGIESILLVGVNVLTTGIILLYNPGSLSDYQLYFIASSPWYLTLVGVYERVMTMATHISLSMMVLEALKGDSKYLVYAVIIHTVLDYLTISAVGYSIVYAEMVLTGFAIGLTQWAYTRIKDEAIGETASPLS